jgi:hypothetical protein
MAAKINMPDVSYGFWVALGVILAFTVVAVIRSLLARAAAGRGGG